MYKERTTAINAYHKSTYGGHGDTRIRNKKRYMEEEAERQRLQGRSIFEALFGGDDD